MYGPLVISRPTFVLLSLIFSFFTIICVCKLIIVCKRKFVNANNLQLQTYLGYGKLYFKEGEYMGIQDCINNYIKEEGITLKEFARRIGISYNTLYAIVKRNSKRIDYLIAQKIAQTIGVTIDELFSSNVDFEITTSPILKEDKALYGFQYLIEDINYILRKTEDPNLFALRRKDGSEAVFITRDELNSIVDNLLQVVNSDLSTHFKENKHKSQTDK